MLRLSLASAAVLLAGCAPQCLEYHVSSAFDPQHVEAIDAAWFAWSRATNVCVEASRQGTEVRPPRDDEEVIRHDLIAHPTDGTKVVGWYDANHDTIVINIHRTDDVYAATMHEVGHRLGLDHYEGPERSWMTPLLNNSPWYGGATVRDAVVVCRRLGCRPVVE